MGLNIAGRGGSGRIGFPAGSLASSDDPGPCRLLKRRLVVEAGRHQATRKALADLTARQAEQQLLTREVDHRAKNSLQLVAAMLALQAREDPQAAGPLNEAVRRLLALAQVHAKHYSAHASERMAVDVWLGDICAGLAVAGRVSVALECPTLLWPFAVVGPLGLFAGEAVANALKHAFSQQGGRVVVRLEPLEAQDRWRITVSDDGRGATSLVGGLGMGLLRTFASQLGARLDVGEPATSTGLEGGLEGGLTVGFEFAVPPSA